MQRPSPRFRSKGYFVYEIFEETFYQDLYGDAMVVLISETNRNMCYRVLLQKREFILRRTRKH